MGSTAAAAAAAPDPAQVARQHLKEVSKCVDKLVKEVLTYCLAQREEGHLCDEVLNTIQGQLCDDVTALESLVKPLLKELIKAQIIEQSNAMESLNNALSMQTNALEKFTQLKTLINLKNKFKLHTKGELGLVQSI